MKTLTCIFWIMTLSTTLAFAQVSPKTATITIHTSANCAQCKATIEQGLLKVKGIKAATVNLATHDVEVTYSTKKTDPGAIRKAISEIGYDADHVQADQEAHDSLPQCCRKGGHD